ncbi:hypothetical protein ACFQ4O_02395 [Methylopila musalis]|uniref:Lipoprotein n=1 Tax=Methylopila musalis TaxID=1134781 RepID=A0ABW3Z4H6_9HYPH
MTPFKTACAAGALLLASLTSACAAPASTPGHDGARIANGGAPGSCNARDVRVRHFAGDGHADTHADHAHLAHGHDLKWSKRNYKGYATKPPCYVRRASALSGDPS